MKNKIKITTPKTLVTIIALLLVVCITSCSKNDSNNVSLSTHVMAVNTAEASLPQDFYVDNNKVNGSAMAYTESSAYATVKAGDHQVQFRNSGSTTVNSAGTLSTSGANYYSVFYTDDKTTVTTTDDHSAPKSNKARVRFINLSSAVASSVDFGIGTGNKIVTGLAYRAASAYYDVDAATTFSLYATGSANVMLSIPVTIQAGHIYTVYISGATTATLSYHLLVQD